MPRNFRRELAAFFDRRALSDSEGTGTEDTMKAMGLAVMEMNLTDKPIMFGRNLSPFSLHEHPDLESVDSWLESIEKPVVEVAVILWLSHSVRSEWSELPKRTPNAHRELFGRIERLCADLEAAINETGHDYYIRGGGWGLRNVSVSNLLTDDERTALRGDLNASKSSPDGRQAGMALPDLAELLRRTRQEAARLKAQGPLHGQPTKRGAERGYFVRRMHELLLQRYGAAPHEVLAALATVVLDEVTDRELVAKLLR